MEAVTGLKLASFQSARLVRHFMENQLVLGHASAPCLCRGLSRICGDGVITHAVVIACQAAKEAHKAACLAGMAPGEGDDSDDEDADGAPDR
jgi:hypothetical protein